MAQNNQMKTGRKILDVILQIFFWIFLAVQILALAILIKKVNSGIDIFPWGEGIGDDALVMLIYWFGVLLCTVLLYIFDSIGPCILSRLTYFVMFAIPFVYPFIGAPAFFYETITVGLYIKVIKWMCYGSYILMFIDIIRYIIAMTGLIKKSRARS